MTVPATTVPATTQPTHAVPAEIAHTNAPVRHPESRSGHRAAPWEAPVVAPEPGPPAATALDPGLAAILRCPLTGGTLIPVDADRLMSDRPFRDGVHPVYPIRNGIACLRPDR
ncbi:hypothetical protein GMA12_04725 [Kocuria sediminis]|uniref:Uncharacterized protein n=1 Tax=Kocuria sediminis TaxID=1038857 RepID=A0A6N8GHQ0_9MICC|nr:hypothetical protein [Kocuria sediminis]MUN62448.1 hypothetical protein [Kocuria sediminis]